MIDLNEIENRCDRDFVTHARGDIAALIQRVRELEEAQRWISVEDRVPLDMKNYQLWIFGGGLEKGFYMNERFFGEQDEIEDVTHWRELPEGPK